MSTGPSTSLTIDNKDIEVVESLCLLPSIIKSKAIKKYATDHTGWSQP